MQLILWKRQYKLARSQIVDPFLKVLKKEPLVTSVF